MAELWILLIAAVAIALASCAATAAVRWLLVRRAIFDHPNPRSSHAHPTPRGGGLGVLAVLLPAWVAVLAYVGTGPQPLVWLVPLAALGLAAISWLDDVRGLGVGPRLAAHLIAAVAGAVALPGSLTQGLLPGPVDFALAVVAWVWFVNLFNFMDGVDGIAGVEAVALGGGVFAFGLVAPPFGAGHLHALAVAATAAGFLVWNWHPARVFLGDVGSIALGYLLGWLLLAAAADGLWLPAAIVALYYFADSGLTIVRRAVRGEKLWRAHREHFYQLAVRRGRSHARVAAAVLVADGGLVALALVAAAAPDDGWRQAFAGVGAVAVTAALLWWMARGGTAARAAA